MKEFIEKLIERLKEEKQRLRKLKNDTIALSDSEVIAIEEQAYNFCKAIVNQLAEEYINTSTDGWIPCSERLPDKTDKYMVTLEDGRVTQSVYDYGFRRFILCPDAIAWQPLPQAYQPKGE